MQMRDTSSKGASAGKVGIVRRAVFEDKGKSLGTVRLRRAATLDERVSPARPASAVLPRQRDSRLTGLGSMGSTER